ncbi:hypothetical protein Vadar_013589 [Vaccinium darrowii]|uniref:Uncharacterized protein n=1 Tax=Vaccinium darrowii TaxID=229202 RepID=A0ACB7XRB6_9ERIC|nr:hypothetical protein Vadar_013589 [Vaccinium darrowii]
MDCDRPELFSLFVDNLPEDVGLNWFRKFFSQYGVVKDAYIPFKRSKVSKKRFGFVRYNCASSAEVAISKANGFWIDNRKLYVKMAAFEAQGFKSGHNGEKHDLLRSSRSVGPLMNKGSKILEKSQGLHEDRPSYAQVTRGVERTGENLATRSVQCHAIGNGNIELVEEGRKYIVRIEEESSFRKVESSSFRPDFDALSVHDDKLSQAPKEDLPLDLGSKVDPIDNDIRSSQGLESLVEDSMGLQSLFHEAFVVEPVVKTRSQGKFLDVNSGDSSSSAKVASEGSDYDDRDLVSNEPLIQYVEHKRHKKSLDTLTFTLEAVMPSVLSSPDILVIDAKAHALPDRCKSEACSGLAFVNNNISPGRDLYGSLPG